MAMCDFGALRIEGSVLNASGPESGGVLEQARGGTRSGLLNPQMEAWKALPLPIEESAQKAEVS